MSKLSNTITVFIADGKPVSHLNSTIVIDNCDQSISIKRQGETIAHYNAGEYLRITQEIRVR